MKKQLLLGLSIAAAAVVMTGCGGGGGGASTTPPTASQPQTGPQEPKQLKDPAPVNSESGAEILQYAGILSGNGIVLSDTSTGLALPAKSQLAKKLKTMALHQSKAMNALPMGGDSFNYTHECSGGGSVEIHAQKSKEEDVDNGKNIYKYEFTLNCDSKNCDINTSEARDMPLEACLPEFYLYMGLLDNQNIRIHLDGKGSYREAENLTEDNENNITTFQGTLESKTDHLVAWADENTSDNVIDFKEFGDFDMKYSIKAQEEGVDEEDVASVSEHLLTADDSVVYLVKTVGVYRKFDGKAKKGSALEGNLQGKLSAQEYDDENDLWQGQVQADGFVALYSLAGNEDNKTLREGVAADNYIVDAKDLDENTTQYAVNGGLAWTLAKVDNDGNISYCGGKAALDTTKDIKRNEDQYTDDDNKTGWRVLPYEGNITIEGNGTAYAGFFADDQNHTHLIITDTNGGSKEYNGTDEVPYPHCGD